MKLSSRCVERRGKVGQAPVYLQGVYGHGINASIFKMRGRLGLFAPATSQDFVLACYPRQWLIFCISYWLHFLSLFLIPECLDLSTASWRVAHSVMSHSDNLFASARQFDMSNQAFISANPRVTCCTLRRPICFSIGV